MLCIDFLQIKIKNQDKEDKLNSRISIFVIMRDTFHICFGPIPLQNGDLSLGSFFR